MPQGLHCKQQSNQLGISEATQQMRQCNTKQGRQLKRNQGKRQSNKDLLKLLSSPPLDCVQIQNCTLYRTIETSHYKGIRLPQTSHKQVNNKNNPQRGGKNISIQNYYTIFNTQFSTKNYEACKEARQFDPYTGKTAGNRNSLCERDLMSHQKEFISHYKFVQRTKENHA